MLESRARAIHVGVEPQADDDPMRKRSASSEIACPSSSGTSTQDFYSCNWYSNIAMHDSILVGREEIRSAARHVVVGSGKMRGGRRSAICIGK
jgi:hypothetical protein